MIQLANAPTAGRPSFRPNPGDGKESFDTTRRSGHAWPFLSSVTTRPQQRNDQKPTASSGS